MPLRIRRRSRRVEGDHGNGRAVSGTVTVEALVDDRAAGLDRARLGELELALHQAVAELAGLDEERLAVAADLLAVAAEDRLERRVAVACRSRARTSTTRWGSSRAGYASTAVEKKAPVMSMRVDGPAT